MIIFLGVYSGLYFRRIVQNSNKRWFTYFHTLYTDDFGRKVRKRDEKKPQQKYFVLVHKGQEDGIIALTKTNFAT